MEKLHDLTKDDFKLLNEGLDILCRYKKEGGGRGIDIMGAFVMHIAEDEDDPRAKQAVERHIKKMKSDKEAEAAEEIENIRILQGKLLLIKRELEAAAAVNGVNDLLK